MCIKKRIIGIILLALIVVGIGVFAASDDDLVVSLGYLNDIFRPSVTDELTFKVVTVPMGARFYGGGGCEFILRGGKATVKASELGGLSDTTSGEDLGAGYFVPANHLVIVPRDDQRGFVAASEVIIMVKGKYSIGK